MIKQTRGALNFLIADYKGVLKNALIASSATFFALTANATDTTIDLTASTPQTDIIVNAGDTVTLNNGKTAFPEDAPYTASKITVADGGTLKITNGGNFKVDELTVKSTNFLPTGEYYAVRPDLQDLNSDRTTITAKNATFEGGTIYHPFTIDNLIVTYPAQGQWNIQTIPVDDTPENFYSQRVSLPQRLWGLTGPDAFKESLGGSALVFCHKTGFLAAVKADTAEAARKAAEAVIAEAQAKA